MRPQNALGKEWINQPAKAQCAHRDENAEEEMPEYAFHQEIERAEK